MNELALFAGAGGGILGGKLLGWKTICAVENNEHARNVLVARQNDGSLEPFPIWDDVRTFDGWRWRGIVDVVSGGFPCQDISAAGNGAGIDGEESGLWKEMARIIGEVRPRFTLVENSPVLTSRGLGRVLGDMAEMGYNARWGVFSAADAGAQHIRERIWIMAHNSQERGARGNDTEANRCNSNSRGIPPKILQKRWPGKQDNLYWSSEPRVGRVANGLALGMDRLERIGNGQVPAVVKLAWKVLSDDEL